MNKFYKVSDSYGTKLVKFDSAFGNDPYGKVPVEVIDVTSSNSGGTVSVAKRILYLDTFKNENNEIEEAEYEAFKDIALGLIDSIKALNENIKTSDDLCL